MLDYNSHGSDFDLKLYKTVVLDKRSHCIHLHSHSILLLPRKFALLDYDVMVTSFKST